MELLVSRVSVSVSKGAFNNYVDKVKGGGGQKMSVFVHAQCIKTVHAGGRGQKWQNSVHVIVECPFAVYNIKYISIGANPN